MKISDQNINELRTNEREALNIPKPQSDRLSEAMKPNPGSASTANRSEIPSDQIDLGGQNGLVARMRASGSGERATRIEQLRALVQAGQYQVDTAALSKSIVAATLNGY